MYLEFIGSWILITCWWFSDLLDFFGFQDGWIRIFLDLDVRLFQDTDSNVGSGFFWIFRIWMLGLDLDVWLFSGIWIWTFGFGLLWIFRIWICSSGFGFGFFLQDIGVDRDTKMLICSAVVPVFRALVVFLRRLVLLSGCLDFGVSSGYGLLTDLIQMYFTGAGYGRALLPDFDRIPHGHRFVILRLNAALP